MTEFNNFFKDLKLIINAGFNDAQAAYEIRHLFTEYITQVNFKLTCMENIVSQMRTRNLALVPPLYTNELFDLRLIYWPPNYANEIHTHAGVTVTGILFNELTFKGYKTNENEAEVEDRSIYAQINDVGYVLPGKRHRVANATSSTSITLHFFQKSTECNGSINDVEQKEKQVSYGQFDLIEHQNIANFCFLSAIKDSQSGALIEKLFDMASLKYKLIILNEAIALGSSHSKYFCRQMIKTSDEPQLTQILEKLESKL